MSAIANRLTLRHLRLVRAIHAEGNLLRAAHALNMTQSAVTKGLQDAEALVGATLFDRTNRGVVPTMFGTSLAAHARLILAQVDNAADELSSLRDGTAGRVAVGTLLAGSAGLLPDAVARLHLDRPNLVLSVQEGTNDVLMPALRSGELDLVIGRLPEFRDRTDLKQDFLVSDHASVVLRQDHPLAGRRGLRLADLLHCDWILPRQQTTMRRQIEAAFRDDGLEPPPHAVETVSFLTTRALLLQTDYLAVWPAQVARLETQGHGIAMLDVALPSTTRPIGVTTRANDRLSPAARLLIAYLHDAAQRLTL